MNLTEFEKKYGYVEFEGKKYVLTEEAYITGNWIGDAHFQMACDALDQEGKEYKVYWIFEDIEGLELDGYDYDDVARVEEI